MWSKSKTCGGDGSFNYVMQPGIAVSNGGEIVAVGSWGCLGGSNDNGSVDGGEILAFVGRNGKSNGMIYFFKKNFFFCSSSPLLYLVLVHTQLYQSLTSFFFIFYL